MRVHRLSCRLHWKLGLIALAALWTAHASGEVCKRVIVSADPEFPPFAWYDGHQLRGASIDIVRKVLDSMHLEYEFRYVGPFVRLLQSARDGGVDIITELKDTPERREFLEYVPTPIFKNPASVFVLADKTFPLRSRTNLRGRTGGVTHGTSLGTEFDDYMARELTVEKAPGIKENFGKLELGRIDYFLSPYYPAMSFLMASGQNGKFVALKPPVATVDNFVGWAKRSPCVSRLPEFNAILRKFVRNGSVQRDINTSVREWEQAPAMKR